MTIALPDGFVMPELVPGKLPHETTVVVAMSGGVDSSCVAALCHAAGYKTIGMTLQLWDYTPASQARGAGHEERGTRGSLRSPEGAMKSGGTCCALDDVYDARRVCQTLGIPHYVLNMESAFKGAVIDDFVETYLAGATPIPCVRCNQRIKFKELLDRAKGLGADVLVTGHYVKKGLRNYGTTGLREPAAQAGDGKAVLMMGADAKKDQSYYLFTTTQEQLEFLNFPLGDVDSKDAVRAMAKQLGLHVHHKKDSYDICFVPGGDYRKVVKKFAPEAEAPGNVVLEDGTVVGTHDGIVGFTVGQRKGVVDGGFSEPMYVVAIRPDTREVVIGPRSSLGWRVFYIKEINWLGGFVGKEDEAGLRVWVKVRAQHVPAPGQVFDVGDGRFKVVLDDPEEQVSPGQAGVMYDADGVMLGGGWIEGTRHEARSTRAAAPRGGRIAVDIVGVSG